MMTLLRSTARRKFWQKSFPSVTLGLFLALSGLAISFSESRSGERSYTLAQPHPITQARMSEDYGKLPLSFEVNRGQTDGEVKFLARGQGYTLFLTSTEAVFQLRTADGGWRNGRMEEIPKLPIPNSKPAISTPKILNPPSATRHPPSAVLRMKLVGANPEPQVAGVEELPGTSNYFIGNDPTKWRTDVPNYARVEYQDVYPGIDLAYYGNQRLLEYDLIVAPGADPNVITFEYRSADQLEVDERGDLVIHTPGGQIRQHKPVIYQEENGVRQEITGGYALKTDHQVGFEIGAYDPDRSLIIDPTLVYSTYLGGSGLDAGHGIAVDEAGNVYVTGRTSSVDFPVMDPLRLTPAGGSSEVFVAKLNPTGRQLIYSTYLGGNLGDEGNDIAVDSAGNVYVAGITGSANFPMSNSLQARLGGGTIDAFVVKLNTTGNALVYSTYLGGSTPDSARAIAVDEAGNVYVTGHTHENFPTVNALQSDFRGGTAFFGGDAFVAKLNPDGSGLLYSSYLGGSGEDIGLDIAVDDEENAYVVGDTRSADLLPQSSLQTFGGDQDAFVAKLNATGSTLVYATYVGGSSFERGMGIAVDASGSAYVTGFTDSDNFPSTQLAFQRSLRGPEDAFVMKLNAAGNGRAYSTYLGGTRNDQGLKIAIDADGNAYITGVTNSTDFRLESPLQDNLSGDGDAFVTKLSAAGRTLIYSTYLGGSSYDASFGIAVDADENAYVIGVTNSAAFPTVSALQPTSGGSSDAFVTKISDP
jgi:hypothetical protein